jgi:hypothetical protein
MNHLMANTTSMGSARSLPRGVAAVLREEAMKIGDPVWCTFKNTAQSRTPMHAYGHAVLRAVGLSAMLVMTAGLQAAEPSVQVGALDQLHGMAPSAEQIVERNVAARGGLQAWRAVTSLSEFGRMEMVQLKVANGTSPKRTDARRKMSVAANDTNVAFTMHMKRPHKFYLQLQYKGTTAIQVFDGEQGWRVMPSPNGVVAVKFQADAARAASIQQDLDGPLIDSAAKGTKVTVEAVELLEGRKTYRLKLNLRDQRERHLWIDAETFLDTKIDGMRMVSGTLWPVETYFSAYKNVQGLQIPHVLDTSIGGAHTTERIIIDHINVNSALDDAIFAAPTYAPKQ